MSKLAKFAQDVGTDIKNIRITIGNMSSLTTTEKNNLVGALNELAALINAGGSISGSQVDTKISQAIATFEAKIMGGHVAEELDTLREIATKIGDIVSKDATQDALLQTLSTLDTRLQALEQVEAVDYLAAYTTARDS